MKRTFLLFLFLNFLFCHSQQVIDLTGSICTYDVRFPFNGRTIDLTRSETGDNTGLVPIIDKMKTIAGMSNNFYTYYGSNINNAFATTYNGDDWIVIDVDFLEQINFTADTDWAGISIIAHEMGHHYFNHTTVSKGRRGELEADYFCGWMLQKLGASKNSSVKAIQAVGTEHDTDSHPNKHSRVKSIKEGWDDAYYDN